MAARRHSWEKFRVVLTGDHILCVAEPLQQRQPRSATKYGSQAHREAISASIRRKWEDPEYRAKVSYPCYLGFTDSLHSANMLARA